MDIDVAALADATSDGFRQDTAEKVYRLIGLLREFEAGDETRGKFTLKGGTALNVFQQENVPRLSVDIHIMATGFPDAVAKSVPRERAVQLVIAAAKRQGYLIQRRDEGEAGCTLHCTYKNTLGAQDQIKVDIDLLNRQTILPADMRRGPALFFADDFRYPVVTAAELLGQKLTAVAYRAHVRDLHDMHRMLDMGWHKHARARAMYLAYSFLHDAAWYRLDYPMKLAGPYAADLLRDVLRTREEPPPLDVIRDRAQKCLTEPPSYASASDDEKRSRDRILAGEFAAFADIAGEIEPSRRAQLALHPGVAWRVTQANRK